MAGDVATAGKAGSGVTQEAAGQGPEDRELPVAGNGVTRAVGAPDSRSDTQPSGTESSGAQLPDTQLPDTQLPDTQLPDTQLPDTQPAPGAEAPSGNGSAPPDNDTAPAESGTEASATNSPTRSMPRDLSTPDGFGSGSSGSGHAGVRRRLGRFGASRGGVNPVLEPLIRTVRTTHPKADIRLIERAYEVAAKYHANQSRKSGDPYITHPLAVATILAELGMNHDTLCAALLHDTIEDTPYTLDELRRDFGEVIATLVDGVTKLDKV